MIRPFYISSAYRLVQSRNTSRVMIQHAIKFGIYIAAYCTYCGRSSLPCSGLQFQTCHQPVFGSRNTSSHSSDKDPQTLLWLECGSQRLNFTLMSSNLSNSRWHFAFVEFHGFFLPSQIPLQALCNGDWERLLVVELYQWGANGRHTLLSSLVTNFAALKVRNPSRQLP